MYNLKSHPLNARIYRAEPDQALMQSIEGTSLYVWAGMQRMSILLRKGMCPVEISAMAVGISSD